jgi:hypothetical protein
MSGLAPYMGIKRPIGSIYGGYKQNRTIVRSLYQTYPSKIDILLRIVLDKRNSIVIIPAVVAS